MNVWREPLVHFLLIGAVLFLAFGLTREQGDEAPNRIVVGPGQVEQLTAQFGRTWLRPPTQDELSRLIEGYIRDEVYYREALAMGLDRHDLMVRQRMRLKLEFLLEDLTTGEAPDDGVLAAYLRQNPERFREEPQVSFRQLYLNPDRHRDLAGVAADMLARLNAGAAPESVGDPGLLPADYTLATPDEIARTFGGGFAQAVVALEPGAWTGPVPSGLGGHLVRVTGRVEGRLPDLADIRGQVERAYLAQRRQQVKDAAYARLRKGYEVVIEAAEPSPGVTGRAVAATGQAGQ